MFNKLTLYKLKRNPYCRFFVKLWAFLVLVFLLDFTAGHILRYFYFKQRSGEEYRTTYSIEKTKDDILIFGSSRANRHYSPEIFENRMGMSCYNVGRDGNFILYHYAVLQGVLKRYTPKIIILDIVKEEFIEGSDNGYVWLSSLLPYYKDHYEMRSIIELRSRYEKLKLISQVYPYNSVIMTIAVGNMEFNMKRMKDYKGYVPLYDIWPDTIKTEDPHVDVALDSIKIKAYESFIQDCLKANIKLYVVCSPYFMKTEKAELSVRVGEEIAHKYRVEFFDYEADSMYLNHHELFADFAHLNNTGAQIFSNQIINNIQKSNLLVNNYKVKRN